MKKYILAFCVILICGKTFGQKMAKINLKDSCIMSGGIVTMADFKKICKICPPEAKKVLSFNVSYPINPPFYGDLAGKGDRYDSKFLMQYVKPGITVVIDNIKIINSFGAKGDVPRMTIGFK